MIRSSIKYIVRSLGISNKKRLVNKTKNVNTKSKTVSMTVQESVEIPEENRRILLMFAHRCLFRCNHCYFWQYNNRYDAMELKDWIRCIDDIYEYYGRNVQIELGGDGTTEINKAMIPLGYRK